jgi:hypothetical protein
MEIVVKKIILVLCATVAVTLPLGCSKSNSFLETHDHNSDGQVSREEYDQTFDSIDSNGDGVISDEDVGSVLYGH